MIRANPGRSRGRNSGKAAQPGIAKQLRIVLLLSLLAAAVAGVLAVCNARLAAPPERLLHVYRTHDCQCVFGWAKTLEAEGFVVRLYEYETLEHVRTRLRVPEDLRGCHVGEYLGYFVEGHVSSATLRSLAQRHPQGRGVVLKSPGANAQGLHLSGLPAGNSAVLFYDDLGVAQGLSDG